VDILSKSLNVFANLLLTHIEAVSHFGLIDCVRVTVFRD
jgi:hypothetical protein